MRGWRCAAAKSAATASWCGGRELRAGVVAAAFVAEQPEAVLAGQRRVGPDRRGDLAAQVRQHVVDAARSLVMASVASTFFGSPAASRLEVGRDRRARRRGRRCRARRGRLPGSGVQAACPAMTRTSAAAVGAVDVGEDPEDRDRSLRHRTADGRPEGSGRPSCSDCAIGPAETAESPVPDLVRVLDVRPQGRIQPGVQQRSRTGARSRRWPGAERRTRGRRASSLARSTMSSIGTPFVVA